MDECKDLRLDPSEDPRQFQHEVLFEHQVDHLGERKLFVGLAYTGRRFFIALGVIAFVIGGLIGRAAWMQIYRVQDYQRLAASNRLRQTPLWPNRGQVFDREGRVLAENVPRFQVTVIPRDLPRDPDERATIIGRTARILGAHVADIEDLLNVPPERTGERILVADQISYPLAMQFVVAEPHLQGFSLETRPKRAYPFSTELPSLSHVLGYVGRMSETEYATFSAQGYQRTDELGKTGLERSYESQLRGTVGVEGREVDAVGNVQALVKRQPPQNGQDLTLSLDVDLQRVAEQSLRKALLAAHVNRGSVVVMDPRDGSILALVSWPAFDDNVFANGISSTQYQALLNDPDHPLFPRAWAGEYPSGSTVKLVVSVAALAEHVIAPSTTVLSTGGLRVGQWFFPDWKVGGHGITDVRKAIALSVNTFYYTVGGGYNGFVGLGVDRLTSWMRRFGLGAPTGIDISGEAPGFVPSTAWKKQTKGVSWYIGDTYNLSIGQGDLLVTPLQVARYTAAIANGGLLMTPHLVMQEAATSTRVGDPADVEVVREGMHDNTTYGSGRALSTLPFPTGGKTGTAQFGMDKQTHGWFTSFAPYDKPEIVVTVMLESGGEGSTVCIPVAKDVMLEWWKKKQSH